MRGLVDNDLLFNYRDLNSLIVWLTIVSNIRFAYYDSMYIRDRIQLGGEHAVAFPAALSFVMSEIKDACVVAKFIGD